MEIKDLKPCLYFSINDENFKKLREMGEDCHITKNDFSYIQLLSTKMYGI